MRKGLFIAYILFFVQTGFAQKGGEAKSPLQQNFELQKYVSEHPDTETLKPKNLFNKTGIADSSFPFIDRFTYLGNKISTKFWLDSNVTKINNTVVFDALNASGNVYPGAFDQADVLTTQPIILNPLSNLYIEINYSCGATWNLNDSLVLQFQSSSGNWYSVWHSSNSFVYNKTIAFVFDPSLLNASNVVFRFINYTQLQASNTENFILKYVVFAHKWDLPLHENLTTFSKDLFPSKVFWAQAQTNIKTGNQYGFNYGNVAVFDALDENLNVYNNANGQKGFADTLQSHYMDITQYSLTDSVYLKFFYRAMPNSISSDSLFLEFKNNAGVWSRITGISGTPFGNLKTFIQQINIGKFRSAAFQFRLINKCTYTASDTTKWIVTGFNIGKKIAIPFVDDFSTTKIYPDQTLWSDKLVYINNHFPIRPPSYNVATFDGLNKYGNPYGYGRGYCDSLTSLSIDLSQISTADTSVYLSFFVEPAGLGTDPYTGQFQFWDSLIIEMRNSSVNPNSFVNKWSAVASSFSPNKFTQVFIRVDSAFLHDDFQFRFKNYGYLTGNQGHWHIDYIRLDKGRSDTDYFYNDFAISSTPTGLLQTYSSMPWSHFISATYQNDSQNFVVKNNTINPKAITYIRQISNQQPLQIDTFGNILPNLYGGKDTLLSIKQHATLTPFIMGDTVSFTTKITIKEGNAIDNIPSNDTFSIATNFSNYFSYDDGSAENGYGLQNRGGSVALGYTLSKPDSIYGMAMFFNQSVKDVTALPFNFMVWKDVGLGTPATGETVLLREPHLGAEYQNKINGFYYYKFQNGPIPVDGKFYVGWEQSQTFMLNMGMDQNYIIDGQFAANPNMYFKNLDLPIWQQTQLTGALMMRPIIGKWIDPPVGLKNITQQKFDVKVYPNPAKNILYIEGKQDEHLYVELLDMTGRLILSHKNENAIQLPILQSGIYLLRITDENQNNIVKKIIIE